MIIRPTRRDDQDALGVIVTETGLFPAEMLPDLIGGYLHQVEPDSLWLTAEEDGTAVGFCYAVPEQLADGTWNMLAIAVLPASQGQGCGAALTRALEKELANRGQRILIVDTSGTEAFEATRRFYAGLGYAQEARIRDFWADGDDKIVFWKRL